MHNIIEKYKKNDMTKHNKEIAKDIYVNKGKIMANKFWLFNYNPITGFPPERILYYRAKPKDK